MKLLSFAIPCYNSQEYMRHCIESILPGGDDVEILIIDDGSKDDTAKIADEYQEKYPGIVKAIHQENGGHGEAVNTGIKNATGIYFKVVDSDDWIDREAYMEVLSTLKEIIEGDQVLDMMVCNFVYEKEGATHKKVMAYTFAIPRRRIITWEQMRIFRKGQYILMHSVIYRTNVLRKSGMVLPKHTFYVDNLFVFEPLPYVKTIYYLPVDFYRYFIGRSDQSVNEEVMIKRIDQQIRVNKLMIDYMSQRDLPIKKMRNYMISYLDIICAVTSIMLIRADNEEALEKKNDLWEYFKEKNLFLYLRIRHGFIGRAVNLPGKQGRWLSIGGYRIAHFFVGFN
ncbi:MAG: glycosyltransferase [Lachnospiraceae bacterium]|nr:glycosyltransferase [Lachnospiraceae bacterium]